MAEDLKRDYREDLTLFEGPWSRGLATAFAFALLLFGTLVAGEYTVFVLTRICLFTVAAVGLNLLMGYAGQISLGHAAFLAVGAYGHTILYTLGAPLLLTAVAGALLAGALGLVVGLPALRLKGPYLAIATLGFQVAVEQILARWDTVTGGRMGLPVPRPEMGVELSSRAYFALCLGITIAVLIGGGNLVRSRVGRAWTAIRDNDVAAESMGVPLARYKTLAFGVSAAVTGLAGALLVHLGDSINPSNFTLIESVELLVIVMVGGLGSILGSVLGSILFVGLGFLLAPLPEYQPIILGLILIAVILFEPMGMRGRWLRIKIYFKVWPF